MNLLSACADNRFNNELRRRMNWLCHDLPDGMNCAYGRISGAVVQRFNRPIVLRLMNRIKKREKIRV